MIERKTTKNRKCPDCSTSLDSLMGRDEDGNRITVLECSKCGDVSEKYLHCNLRERWVKELEEAIPKDIFVSTWNKETVYLSCVNCLTVYTHPRSYCVQCNGKTERNKVDVTVGEWLKRAPNNKELRNRFRRLHSGTVWFNFVYPDLSFDEGVDKRMEILGVLEYTNNKLKDKS